MMTRLNMAYGIAIFLWAYAATCVIMTCFGDSGLTKVYALNEELSQYDAQNQALTADINRMQGDIRELDSETWRENQARTHLGMIKSRETYYQIQDGR